MNILFYIICVILFLLTLVIVLKIIRLKNIEYKNKEILLNKKILIIYYSNGGNTKDVAEKLHSIVSGDLKELELREKYPKNLFKMSNLVRKQIKEGYLPQVKEINISDYDIIFTASPIWNSSISLPMKHFLKNNNFENKILIPVFTYSGGAFKKKVWSEIKDFTNATEIKKHLFMFENGIFLIKEQLINWLNKL